jgi:hypothetical protein
MPRSRSVGIATCYGLDVPGIESRWGRDFPHLSRPALGPTQPPMQCLSLKGSIPLCMWRYYKVFITVKNTTFFVWCILIIPLRLHVSTHSMGSSSGQHKRILDSFMLVLLIYIKQKGCVFDGVKNSYGIFLTHTTEWTPLKLNWTTKGQFIGYMGQLVLTQLWGHHQASN